MTIYDTPNVTDSIGNYSQYTTLDMSGGTPASTLVSSSLTIPYNSSMTFNVDGVEIEFSGDEIKRLKEMLTIFIEEKHPEDLL